MSLTRDPRVPKELTYEQKSMIDQDLRLVSLHQQKQILIKDMDYEMAVRFSSKGQGPRPPLAAWQTWSNHLEQEVIPPESWSGGDSRKNFQNNWHYLLEFVTRSHPVNSGWQWYHIQLATSKVQLGASKNRHVSWTRWWEYIKVVNILIR
jgi:hypothetical protein